MLRAIDTSTVGSPARATNGCDGRSPPDLPRHRIDSPKPDFVTDDQSSTYNASLANPRYNPGNAHAKRCDEGPNLAELAEALGTLDDAERADVIEHVRALARLSLRRRTAILTLTNATD
jgi:hypothetical protein